MHIAAAIIFFFASVTGFALQENSGHPNDQAVSSASDRGILEGTVMDPDEASVPNASVAVLEPESLDLVTGIATDSDGSFSIELEPDSYLIRISYLSYQTFEREVEIEANQTENLGEIILGESVRTMDEVVIEADQLDMELRFDRRVYRADGDIETFGGTALDLLDNVPSVETDMDGEVLLRGSENVRVLINGRPSAMLSGGTEALAALPSESIDRIEVITNPSARYDAEGDAGVINIVLKRNRAVGFNGTVVGQAGHPGRAGLSSNVNFMTNNANWFANAGFRYRERPSSSTSFQRFNTADTSFMYDQTQERIRTGLRGDIRIGAELFLTENSTLTPSVFFRARGRDEVTENSYRDMDLEGNLIREVFREDEQDRFRTNTEFALAYEYLFDEESERRLNADFKFDYRPEDESSDLIELNQVDQSMIARQRTRNDETRSNILLQVDYIQSLGESMEMELGAKSEFRRVDNEYLAEELVDQVWEPLPGFNDNYRFNENVNAAYAILSRSWGSFSAQAGLRAEQTGIDSELTLSGDGTSQNYFNIFPSMFATYDFNDRHSVQASYSRRLSRPRFRSILPFSNLRDSRNITMGNPSLEPVFSNSYELSYIMNWESGSLMSSVYHRYRTGVIERITEVDSEGITTRMPVNLSSENNWGLELNLNQTAGSSLRLRWSANYFLSDREGEYNDQVFERNSNVFFGRFRVQWRVAEGFNVQSTFRYSGPRSTTQGHRDGSYSVNSGIAKELFDGKATLSITGRDLFNTRGRTVTMNDPNFYSQDETRWRARSLRLNFTWRFSQFD